MEEKMVLLFNYLKKWALNLSDQAYAAENENGVISSQAWFLHGQSTGIGVAAMWMEDICKGMEVERLRRELKEVDARDFGA